MKLAVVGAITIILSIGTVVSWMLYKVICYCRDNQDSFGMGLAVVGLLLFILVELASVIILIMLGNSL